MTAIIQETLAPEEQEYVFDESQPKEDSKEFDDTGAKILRTSGRYKVVFPVGDGSVSEQAFQLALQTAKRFSATLVLVYLAKPFVASDDGFLEYAKVEGVKDYEWLHYETLSRARLECFANRADEEGVIWERTFSLGGTRA